jgi:PAS domain S-box-containing protein
MKTQLSSNVSEDDSWRVIPVTSWIRSYLGAPIFAGSECIGVINLESSKLNAFTLDHVKRIQAFLDQASVAIQNTRYAENLVQEVEKRTQELQAERAQFQAILSSTGEGIFYSQDFTMRFTNEKLSEMMGYTAEEMLGQSSLIFRPDDLTEAELHTRQKIQTDLYTTGLSRAELRFKRKDGSIFMGGVTASIIKVQNGVRESVTVVRDISKEKEIEAQKETFISNASHELRGPISTLNMRMYIMRNKPVVMQDDVEKLEVVVQKMNALVAGLLDLSRFESGRIKLNLQSVILQDVLEDVMLYQLPEAEGKQIMLTYTAPEEPITMIADSLRVNQVLTNLVANSINYTLEKGDIKVIVDYEDDSKTVVIIEVTDNGIGIDEESLKTIFQPFSQAHNNRTNTGTGLGLSISKQIVEAHGGHVQVESVDGEGSSFTIYMPTTALTQDD